MHNFSVTVSALLCQNYELYGDSLLGLKCDQQGITHKLQDEPLPSEDTATVYIELNMYQPL